MGHWRMRGFFETQIWSAGVRQLDNTWSTHNIHDLQHRADGSSPFFRERLFQNLLSEEVQLKSIPAGDVTAAQGDLSLLSLRQLLRLRHLHLHIAPGSWNVDSIHSASDAHMAFIAKLDGLLSEELGRLGVQAVQDLIDFGGVGVSDLRRFGHSLLLISAVAPSLPAPAWWVCRFADCILYFHANDFVCSKEFPCASNTDNGGALEIVDSSAAHGRMLHVDWQISLVSSEAELSQSKLQKFAVPTGDTQMRPGCLSAPPRQTNISADAIQSALAKLRKTNFIDNADLAQ